MNVFYDVSGEIERTLGIVMAPSSPPAAYDNPRHSEKLFATIS